jgi:hypothetical protein
MRHGDQERDDKRIENGAQCAQCMHKWPENVSLGHGWNTDDRK